jgi:hypothetical protein
VSASGENPGSHWLSAPSKLTAVSHDHALRGERESPPESRRRGSLDSYDTIVVLCGIASLGIASVYWLMRVGFENPVMPVAKSAALALFIYSFPQLFDWMLRVRRERPDEASAHHVATRWWSSFPFLWLVAIALTAALGRATEFVSLDFFPALALVGALSFLAVFVRWIRSAPLWRSLLLAAGAAVFSVWTSGVVWGRIYKNPLFYENFVLNGRVHHDSLGLATIANMLRTYHVATTGVDGLNYVPYHWGTQWLFAQWSNLLGAHVLDFYQLGFPVTMIPFFFGGTLAFAVAVRNRRVAPSSGEDLRADLRLWFVFLAACIGIMPVSGLDSMGVWTSNLLISESYTVAMPCALLMLATIILFGDGLTTRTDETSLRLRTIGESLFVLIGIPLFVVALGYLKISFMFLGFALAIYTLVRLRLYRQPVYLASVGVLTVLFVVAYGQVSLPAHREGFTPFDFLWSFVKPAWWPFFFIVHLFWSWLYIFVRLKSEGIGTLADLREAAAEQRILDVEIVALVAVLGLGPGLVTHIDGGSAFYFSDVQRWLAVGFLLSRVPMFADVLLGESPPRRVARSSRLSSRIDALGLRAVLLAFLLLPIVGSMISNSIVWPVRMARANAETRLALYPEPIRPTIPAGVHGLPQLHDPTVLARGLRSSPNYLVAETLRGLSRIPPSTRRRTALFIPQDQTVFWQSLTRPGACTFQPFVATALASMAMVDGMPRYDCVLNRYYGFGSFTPRTRPQTPADVSPGSLCRHAELARLDRVLVLTFADRTRAFTNTLQCPPRS